MHICWTSYQEFMNYWAWFRSLITIPMATSPTGHAWTHTHTHDYRNTAWRGRIKQKISRYIALSGVGVIVPALPLGSLSSVQTGPIVPLMFYSLFVSLNMCMRILSFCCRVQLCFHDLINFHVRLNCFENKSDRIRATCSSPISEQGRKQRSLAALIPGSLRDEPMFKRKRLAFWEMNLKLQHFIS